MRNDKRRLAKIALWMLTLVVPVFIAACYGAPQQYSRTGQPQPGPVDGAAGQPGPD